MQNLFGTLFFIALLALIVGLFKPALVIRWGEVKTRGRVLLVYGVSIFIFFIMIGVTAPELTPEQKQAKEVIKQQDEAAKREQLDQAFKEKAQKEQATQQQKLEQQQASYKAWYDNTERKLTFYDNAWKGWKKVWGDLGNGEIDRYTAYSKLKHIDDLLNKNQNEFFEMKPPKDLSDEHKKLLKDASEKMGTAASIRRDAVKNAMEFLDNPKPSTQQNVLDNIKTSDSFALDAIAQIVKVREELQLPAPEQK